MNKIKTLEKLTSLNKFIGRYYLGFLMLALLFGFSEQVNSLVPYTLNMEDIFGFSKSMLLLVLTMTMVINIIKAMAKDIIGKEYFMENIPYIFYSLSIFFFYSGTFQSAFLWYLDNKENTANVIIFLFICSISVMIIDLILKTIKKVLEIKNNNTIKC